MEVRPLTEIHGRLIATWRYPDRYSTYDIRVNVDASDGYWAVVDAGGDLVGFCCFGREARVPGVAEEPGTLDIGYGMRPDLIGKGSGRDFVATVLAFGSQAHGSQRQRLLILDWNDRSLKVAQALGFEDSGIARSGDRTFIVLTRPSPGVP